MRQLRFAAILAAIAVPVAVAWIAYARRPAPPVAPASVLVALPNVAEAAIEPKNAAATRGAGEVVAALARPFRVVLRGPQSEDEFYAPGGGPMLIYGFAPPIDTTEGPVRRIRLSGLERSHRSALLYFEPSGEALVFLMPEFRSRHWRVERFAHANDQVFAIGLKRMQLAQSRQQPAPPAPSSTENSTPGPGILE